jgi:uncharacterized membrane protein (DUF4010 family)
VTEPSAVALAVAAATLGGAAVGFERQWSGHASGASAHFAGVRTFALLGGLAGLVGLLWRDGHSTLAAVLLAGVVGLVVAAYVAASRREIDGTTEVAALVVLAAGVLAGLGRVALASGAIAVTSLLLAEKSKLHGLVRRVDAVPLRAAFRFAVMALVILPLLPEGPFGPLGGIRPQRLWMFVLLFSGLGFVGYGGHLLLGPHRGHLVAGALGGVVSSTAVTLAFARSSRERGAAAAPLAAGVVAACTMVPPRVLAVAAVFNPEIGVSLWRYLVPPLAAGMIATGVAWRQRRRASGAPTLGPQNPLQVRSALQMAALFQVVMFAVAAVRLGFGDAGVLVSAVLAGAVDVDALVLALVANVASGVVPTVAALGIALGVLANSLLKCALAVAVGSRAFRRQVLPGMVVLLIGSVAGLVWGWG